MIVGDAEKIKFSISRKLILCMNFMYEFYVIALSSALEDYVYVKISFGNILYFFSHEFIKEIIF